MSIINPARIIQIVPRLPPELCGVGDYALRIGSRLQRLVDTQYVSSTIEPEIDASSHYLELGNASHLCTMLESLCGNDRVVILLQQSGYGYGKRGICRWLVTGLERFLRGRPNARLLTMFHELWVPGTWYSRSGWLAKLQRRDVRALCAISHSVVTNRAASAEILRRFRPDGSRDVASRPVFSNLGEIPSTAIPNRKHQLVLFQPPGVETSQGKAFWEAWRRVQQAIGPIATIVAGRPRSVPKDALISQTGFLTEAAASDLLTESRFSMLEYFPGYYAKSSIFAALAAHGLGCILTSDANSEADGLRQGEHYLLVDDLSANGSDELASCGRRLQEWYAPHSIEKTANFFWAECQRLAHS